MAYQYYEYTVINQEPLSVVDMDSSKSDEAAILSYIPGSTIRGAVLNRFFTEITEEEQKAIESCFYDGTISFLNIYPVVENSKNDKQILETIPVPKGFYEDRQAEGDIVHIFTEKEEEESKKNKKADSEEENKFRGKKRAKVGKFAMISETKLLYTTPEKGEIFKIRLARNDFVNEKKKQSLFRGDYLEKGQVFKGYVAIAEGAAIEAVQMVKTLLTVPGIRLGSNKSSGYGLIQVKDFKKLEKRIPYESLSRFADSVELLDMVCLSNLCMTNEFGEPCGLNTKELAEKLGCETVEIKKASSSVIHIHGFNRALGGHQAEYPVYEAGSVFRLKCIPAVSKEKIQAVEDEGLGILQTEGLGRVIFADYLEKIETKEKRKPSYYKETEEVWIPKADIVEMKKYCAVQILKQKFEKAFTKYVLDHPFQKGAASKSQRGQILAMCKTLRYKPLEAEKTFETYFAHITQKEDASRTFKVNGSSQKKMIEEVSNILETDIWKLFAEKEEDTSLDSRNSKEGSKKSTIEDSIMGYSVSDLLNKEETMLMKLRLIEEMIQFSNREEKNTNEK